MGKILAVCISKERKSRAWEQDRIRITMQGIEGDIHCGMNRKHPMTFLPVEKIREGLKQLGEEESYGRFGENLVTEGLNPEKLIPGQILCAGEVRLQVARIGADCPASEAYRGFKVCSPMEPYFVFCDVITEGELIPGTEIDEMVPRRE